MTEICKYCRRPVQGEQPVEAINSGSHFAASYATVNHSHYGCDTGCCGYSVVTYDHHGSRLHSKFEFDHPWFDPTEYADENLLGFTEQDYNRRWAEDLVQSLFGNVPIKWEWSDVQVTRDC